MIEFRINPNLGGGGRGVNVKKCLKKVKIIDFFYIFLDSLHKMKENLDQEHVKVGLPSFQGKIGKIAFDFAGKMTVSSLTLLFHLSLPKIWLSHPHKNYISEMRNNRAISWKSFMILSLRLWIW